MKTDRHPCGCVSERDRERWVRLCEPHGAETYELRQRWAADHRRKNLLEAAGPSAAPA